MSATTYTDQRDYIKFLKKKAIKESCGCGGGCDSCKSSDDCDDCGCCPAGLVAIYDDRNNHIACVTPNDAELYTKNSQTCQDGYLRLIRLADGEFFGCVSEANFKELYDNINGLNS
ncbi:MAG TPA: hypothetical protein ACFYEK_01395 [Candidatus Wunengus sp. YC60]|uniref:hypothetical protein n=1 Tax=Candidatus Wunengus sp. YC60 TaxID=3367697 RepID=UPI004025D4CC